MTFTPGQSGNANGRAKGIPDKRTRFRKLLEPHAEDLIGILVEQAKKGEPTALRLCIERLIPRARSEMVNITLPEELTNESVIKLGDQVLRGLEAQEMTVEEASEIFKIIESHINIVVAKDLLEKFKVLQTQLELSKGNKMGSRPPAQQLLPEENIAMKSQSNIDKNG